MKPRLTILGLLAAFFGVCAGGLFVAAQGDVGPQAPTPATRPATGPAVAAADGWPDHRPIGVVFLSEGGFGPYQPGFRSAANPRGWNPYFHKSLDVTQPGYPEQFDENVDAFVQQSFDRAGRFGCQGVLFWDVEGSEFDHPVTYVGDPLRLPPEMKRDRVRRWVEGLQQRGMWAGFTFRDTTFVHTPYGPDQVRTDPLQTLLGKTQAARFAYGANVKAAYVDTFVEPCSWSDGKIHARPAEVLAEFQARVPGWLVIPEYCGVGYDRVPRVAPMRHMAVEDDPGRGVKAGDLLPSGQPFEVLMPYDVPVSTLQRTAYLRALRSGALTFVNVTWDSPHTAWVPQLAAAAARPLN